MEDRHEAARELAGQRQVEHGDEREQGPTGAGAAIRVGAGAPRGQQHDARAGEEPHGPVVRVQEPGHDPRERGDAPPGHLSTAHEIVGEQVAGGLTGEPAGEIELRVRIRQAGYFYKEAA